MQDGDPYCGATQMIDRCRCVVDPISDEELKRIRQLENEAYKRKLDEPVKHASIPHIEQDFELRMTSGRIKHVVDAVPLITDTAIKAGDVRKRIRELKREQAAKELAAMLRAMAKQIEEHGIILEASHMSMTGDPIEIAPSGGCRQFRQGPRRAVTLEYQLADVEDVQLHLGERRGFGE